MSNLTSINRDTKYYGILGYPLAHTLSPLIHNSLFSMYKQNSVYIVVEKEYPDKFFLFREKGLIKLYGLSVTIPHKEWAYEISDECDERGGVMHSSNTLILTDEGHIKSYNTDGIGAYRSIKEVSSKVLESKDSKVLILGSGGSARGISFELLMNDFPGEITIASRNEETGRGLVNSLNQFKENKADYEKLNKVENKKYNLIINTTPIGMKGKPSKELIGDDFLTKKTLVFDIVYNPFQTPLIKQAMKVGSKIVPGYNMLLYQAVEQFKIFTGIEVSTKNISIIRKMIKTKLNIKN